MLNGWVEAEPVALLKDVQARFPRIRELLEGFGPRQVGLPHAKRLG